MIRLVLAVAIVALASIAADVVRRRRTTDAPTQPAGQIPTQLDRADFGHIDAPWLIVVFSSSGCSTCADVISKANVARSDDVAVVEVSFPAERLLHERYSIDSVPCLVVADAHGVVQASFLGPVTAADLWATVAEARAPGSIVSNGGCDRHAGTTTAPPPQT